ncbi:MAG: hypothetical protein EP298_03940 [Gammaproteobacteria bacterium]|nr:MAG: hypothetical protein EP298_03940 [Gammaproteobacteria bacterium]UTW43780.1 hypothetical protein KFE69_06745 [bacterium SCSIO 12844]
MSFLDDSWSYLVEVSAKVPDLDYIVGTAVSTTAKNNGLFRTSTHIGSQTVTKVGNGWNYLDSAVLPFLIGYLYYQNETDQVNDKVRQENKAKMALLSLSFVTSIALTATGFGSIGFAIGTGLDFLSASYDFYDSARKYRDYEYWLECELFKLDHINRHIDKLNQIDRDLEDKEKSLLDQLNKLIEQKINILSDIKNNTISHYHNNFQSKYMGAVILHDVSYKDDFDQTLKKIINKNNFETIESNNDIGTYITSNQLSFNHDSKDSEGIKQAEQNTQKIKSSLKADLNDKGVMLVLKTASMVAMTLLAVGTISAVAAVHANPIGLAISLSVAAGYLVYSFGLPAAKKLWNSYCDKQESSNQQNKAEAPTFFDKVLNFLPKTKEEKIVLST